MTRTRRPRSVNSCKPCALRSTSSPGATIDVAGRRPRPDFTATSHQGLPLSLSDWRGKKVLLWFFPEADTPGCSLEGRGFRDHQSYYDDSGIRILGVSFDPVERNAAFALKYDFKFPLLCDVDRKIGLAYGACSDAKAQYAERISFLIDENGKIARVYDRVDPRDHPAKVLAEILDEPL